GRPLFVKTAHMETRGIGALGNKRHDGSLVAVIGRRALHERVFGAGGGPGALSRPASACSMPSVIRSPSSVNGERYKRTEMLSLGQHLDRPLAHTSIVCLTWFATHEQSHTCSAPTGAP